ncbi:hypothetical protein EW146_g8540 [Bondarzewia mesenterica]|uniref:UBC core domain-containing protein n=1 Tax=Bondarzewia mesenterica TaxID=1095465 RepID=A0A4S4LDT9_9AGAM|nr:hypothetical protein EW146_g8540 [Bondarzewia mesenterica]
MKVDSYLYCPCNLNLTHPKPSDYPLSPFKMKFEPPLFHPNSESIICHATLFNLPLELSNSITNLARSTTPDLPREHIPLLIPSSVRTHAPARSVYPDGNVCISILHTPGDDPLMYEQASERWSPVQSVEKVILSVISMLAGLYIVPSIYPFLSIDSNVHGVSSSFLFTWSRLLRTVHRLPYRAQPGKRRQHRLLQALPGQQSGTRLLPPSYSIINQ